MKIITYNIQNDYSFINNNVIKNKAKDITSLIKQYDIDIIGFQELSIRQVNLYKKLLDNYIFIGNHRRSGILSSEYNALFIKRNIEIIDYKTYSLSNNMERLGSRLKGHRFPRICTLCHINYDNNKLLILNTHLDNTDDVKRKEELDVLKKIIEKEQRKEDIILLGDFNMNNNELLKSLAKELDLINCTSHLGNTFISNNKQIDHIFISKKLKCNYKEKLLVDFSDHYPLIISILD